MIYSSRYARCTRRLDYAFRWVDLDDNTVFAELFLDKDNLLCAFDYEVTARIQGALRHSCQLRLVPPVEPAFVASEHDGQPTNVDIRPPHYVLPSGVLNSHQDWRTVRCVSQATFVRRNRLVDRIRVCTVWKPDMDIRILQPEARIDVGGDFVVRLKNILDVDIYEVIE